jgi:hypothetical protein
VAVETQTLLEKLEALRARTTNHSYNGVYNNAVDRAIAIVRQHQAEQRQDVPEVNFGNISKNESESGLASGYSEEIKPSWGKPCYGYYCGCDGCKAETNRLGEIPVVTDKYSASWDTSGMRWSMFIGELMEAIQFYNKKNG